MESANNNAVSLGSVGKTEKSCAGRVQMLMTWKDLTKKFEWLETKLTINVSKGDADSTAWKLLPRQHNITLHNGSVIAAYLLEDPKVLLQSN